MKHPLILKTLLGAATVGLLLPTAHAQEPEEAEILALWDFEDSGTPGVALDSVSGIEGEVIEAEYAEGRNGGFSMNFDVAGATIAIVGTEENKAGFLNQAGARDQLSVVYWQKWDVAPRNSSSFWARAEGQDRAFQSHTPWGNGTVYFDSTGGCCDAATIRTQVAAPDVPFEEWVHFSIIKDGPTKRIYANGELLIENENTGELSEAFEDFFIGSAPDGANNLGGRIDDFAVFAGALTEEQVLTLADPSNSVISILDNSNPGISLNADQNLSGGTLPALSSAQELRFSVKNTVKADDERGAATLNISSLEITGGDTDNFTLVSFPASLEPSTSDDIVLSFDNKGEFGAFSVTANVKSNDEDADDQDINITFRATVLNPVGPIAHYPLDEANDTDPVADTTGLGRTGAYQGGPTLSQAGLKDSTGTAVNFNGGSRVEINTFSAGSISDFTMSLWINPASLGDLSANDFRTIIAKGDSSPAFGLLEGNGEFVWFGELDGEPTDVFATSGLGLTAGTTYHVAMRFDSATQTGTFFVDGVDVGSGDISPFEDVGTLYIGAFNGGALPFDGTIDDVQIYDLALDDAQIAYLIANPGQPLVPVGAVDTDLDGLTDDDETNIHETDPLVADTDEDGLEDGAEITANTNPLIGDTDGDGFSDGFEVTNDYDALDPSVPNISDFLLVQYDFEEGSGTDVANTGSVGAGGTIENLENGEWRTGSPSTGGSSYLYFGPDGGGATAMHVATGSTAPELGISGETNYTMMAWVNVDDTTGDHMVFGQAADESVLHNGTRAAAYHQGHWGNDTGGGTVVAGEWHHVAFTYDGTGQQQAIYVDGVEVASGGAKGPLLVEAEIVIGTTRAADTETRDMVGGIDEVRIYSVPLGAAAIGAIAGIGDSDGDGLDDALERATFGDLSQDANGDPDEDTLINSDEFARGTNPTLADTDGDSLNDNVEISTEPNSDPLIADTDSDGLNDGEERTAGTSPTNPDTDNDGFSDSLEIAEGQNPLLAGDFAQGPNPYGLLAYFEFNDADNTSVTVGSKSDRVGTLSGATYTADAGGRTGAAGDYAIDGVGGQVIVEDGTFFNEGAVLDTVTVSFWQNLNTITASSSFWAISPSSNNGERGFQAHSVWSDGAIYFDTAGCCAGPQRLTGPPGDVDLADGSWHHFAYVKDGENKSVWIDGVMVLEGGGAAALPTDFTTFNINGNGAGANLIDGFIDDFAVYATALPEGAIAQLATGTSANALESDGNPPTPTDDVPIIGTVVAGPTSLGLSFEGLTGETYDIEYSQDLIDWEVIESDLSGAVNYEDSDATRQGRGLGFYRAVQK